MKISIFILAIIACLFNSCGDKQSGSISKDVVQRIIEEIQPKTIDYEAMRPEFVISPDNSHIFVLESEKEKVMEILQVEVLSEFKWEIQLFGEKHISIVNYVSSVSEFAGIYPVLIAGLSVGADWDKMDCTGKVEKNTLESAACEKIRKGSYVKNVYSVTRKICEDVETDIKCYGIMTDVGTQYFYGDNIGCTGEPIGNHPISKVICLYD